MIKEFISCQCEDWGESFHKPCTNVRGLWLLDDLAEFLSEWEKRPGCVWSWNNDDNTPWGWTFRLIGDQESLVIAVLTWDDKWGSPC